MAAAAAAGRSATWRLRPRSAISSPPGSTEPGGATPARGAAGWHLTFRSWQREQGLPQNSVRALAQTRDGYLWIGSDDGVARFDGVRFVSFGLREGLRSGPVRTLFEDSHGTLWIGTAGSGLTRWQDGQFTTFTSAGWAAGRLDHRAGRGQRRAALGGHRSRVGGVAKRAAGDACAPRNHSKAKPSPPCAKTGRESCGWARPGQAFSGCRRASSSRIDGRLGGGIAAGPALPAGGQGRTASGLGRGMTLCCAGMAANGGATGFRGTWPGRM